MLTLGTFMTIAKVVENVGYIFPTLKVVSICVNFGKTRVGLYFGRFFTLTHLVTLVDSYIPNCISGNIYVYLLAFDDFANRNFNPTLRQKRFFSFHPLPCLFLTFKAYLRKWCGY
jgi:hypothetical protein